MLDGMNSGTPWRLGHRPALDGLRGVAIALVLLGHLLDGRVANALGSVGVTVFFTLSGFLITALLLDTHARGSSSLLAFYRRRAARLLPALLVMVPVVAALGMGPWWRPLAVLGYVANWPAAFGTHLGPFEHTWSLAIEEQFYMLWPIALLGVIRWRNGPLALALAGSGLSLVVRTVLWVDGATADRFYYGSDTRADGLLVGCALAALCVRSGPPRVSRWLPTLALAGVVCVALAGPGAYVEAAAIPTVVPWITALVIAAFLPVAGWLGRPILHWLGSRSYGIYLWHYPFMLIAALSHAPLLIVALAGVASMGVAEMSWRFVEQPVLRRNAAQMIRKKSQNNSGVAPSEVAAMPMVSGVKPGFAPASTGTHA
jgi:peptidoglycan/LPS O-acetylase OafA/YrhL